MKVAHLLGNLNRGGAESLVFNIFDSELSKAFSPILIHRKQGALLGDFKNTPHDTIFLKKKGIKQFIYLRKLLRKRDIDIIHVHQVFDGVLALTSTFNLKTKIVFTVHGHGLNDKWWQRVFRDFVLNMSNKNIFVSHSLKDFYLNSKRIHRSDKNTTLYNGVDIKRFPVVEKSNSEEVKLSMIGNFTSVRDHETIARFLILLERSKINFHFSFIGGWSSSEMQYFEECLKLCEDLVSKKKVSFLGARSDIPKLLSETNLFVYSSNHDTFGIAVVEAIITGTPVFVNDWEVMKEVTNNGEWATLYKSKDEYDLLDKFLDYHQNRTQYNQKAKENAVKAIEVYSIEKHIEKLHAIYCSVV
jgi:glycosyltransferase involved in cell wall biosynthesis